MDTLLVLPAPQPLPPQPAPQQHPALALPPAAPLPPLRLPTATAGTAHNAEPPNFSSASDEPQVTVATAASTTAAAAAAVAAAAVTAARSGSFFIELDPRGALALLAAQDLCPCAPSLPSEQVGARVGGGVGGAGGGGGGGGGGCQALVGAGGAWQRVEASAGDT